ncbi:MAG: hypothetical protein WBA05_16025 [Gordonia sp. (in: high G+C Gram-positive bacteria)]|uniref:hypothetical protein n=1 Tax=Gordonia TaxID=2053 RepID=UPI00326364D6
MAKESGPRARPITVSELIARSEPGGTAFPKASDVEDRTARRTVGASGMPAHDPEPANDPEPPRAVGASGMPVHPPTRSAADEKAAAEAAAVTGIIPVVADDDDTETDLAPVPADDPVGVHLPSMEYRGRDAEQVTETLDVVDDEADEEDEGDHRRVASAADLATAQEEERERERAEHEGESDEESAAGGRGRSALFGWLGLVAETVLGLAAGAGLFWGFTELWKRYVYLALILAVVVIFAIVTFAHVLRKRDLPTTLLALGVGMLVTIGPLVLLAA